MKTLVASICFLLTVGTSRGDDFLRNLPDIKFAGSLTSEKLKNFDAVIILKEQSLNSQPTSFIYRGLDLNGLSLTRTKVMIVKLLTEEAVQRYGSVEYGYREWFGDEFKSGIAARARVMKPDGAVMTMPEEDVSIIVTRERSDGTALERKALFKIPNLAPGDVVQYEIIHTEPFVYAPTGIFFYNDRDPVLYSNVYITLPAKWKANFYSLPPDRVGEPKMEQVSAKYGSGETRFWGLKNLNHIPYEPYARPFADQSLLTAFVVEHYEPSGMHMPMDWDILAREFYKHYIDEDEVADRYISALGFSPGEKSVALETVDRLYGALRKNIFLMERNSVYPVSDDIASVLEKKKGGASDLSYILYRILKKWNQNARPVLIRDKREGMYETTIPSRQWFDRLGVLVTIGDTEQLYDFDRCVAAAYELPWYLQDINVFIVESDKGTHKKITARHAVEKNICSEVHHVTLGTAMRAKDAVVLSYKGSAAMKYRSAWYGMEPTDVRDQARLLASENSLASVDTTMTNKFLEEQEIRIHAVGEASSRLDRIESFITFQPKNHLLREFHKRFSSTSRLNPIFLDEPFKLRMEWNLTIPNGYKAADLPAARRFSGVGRATCSVTYAVAKDTLKIVAEDTFPETIIDVPQYKEFVTFLSASIEAVEKEVVLTKK